MKRVPVIPAPSGEDKEAQEEAKAIRADKYEQEAKANQHGRNEKVKDFLLRAFLFLATVVLIVLFSMLFTWAYHFLTPASWHYLDTIQVEKIQNMVLSGALSALASNFAKEYIKKWS